MKILPSFPFPWSLLGHAHATSGSKNGYQKRRKRRVGKFWCFVVFWGFFVCFFFSCLTPGPPQRDFLSAAAFEVDLSWLVGFVLL